MHQSIFSYNLTRPYPYAWFTWVVVIGGIITTALFTVVSVAANGYDTALVTVANPNETETPSSPVWYQRQPWSLANKISPKCQDQVFTVGSDVYTTSLGYKYLLQFISKANDAAYMPRNSLAYHHSDLQDCFLRRIAMSAWPSGFNISFWTSCTVYDNHIPVSLDLLTYWDSSQAPAISYTFGQVPSWFIWADGLMFAEQLSLFGQMTSVGNGSDWTAQGMYFFTRPTDTVSEPRVLSTASISYGNKTSRARIGGFWLDEYLSGYTSSVLANKTNVSLLAWTKGYGLNALPFFDTFADDQDTYPQPWNASDPIVSLALSVDGMARLLRAGILSDVGQRSPMNMLSDPQAVFDYTDAMVMLGKETKHDSLLTQLATYLGKASMFEFNETTRQNISSLFAWANTTLPGVEQSFLNTLYLCQIPKMKPILSVIFAVIIADLVFVQAMYVVFGFVVKIFLERQDDTANYCPGCNARMQHNDHYHRQTPDSMQFLDPGTSSNASVHEKGAASLARTNTTNTTTTTTTSIRKRPAQTSGSRYTDSVTLLPEITTTPLTMGKTPDETITLLSHSPTRTPPRSP